MVKYKEVTPGHQIGIWSQHQVFCHFFRGKNKMSSCYRGGQALQLLFSSLAITPLEVEIFSFLYEQCLELIIG
jgi:hypothetical protein